MKKIIALLLIVFTILPTFTGCDIIKKMCSHTIGEWETISAKPSTCTERGITEGKKCSVCGEITVAQEEISALGHIYEYFTESDENGNRTNVAVCKRDECGERKTVTDKERLIGEWRNAAVVNEGDFEITINYYVHRVGDNLRPLLPLEICGNDIYLFNNLYDKVEYVTSYNVDFTSILYTNADKIVNGNKVSTTLEKLKSCEGCNVLITDEEPSNWSRKILVFQMDGYFYFLTFRNFDDQMVDRINSTNFKDGV